METSLSLTILILTFYNNFKEKPLGLISPQRLSHFTLISFKGAAQVCLMEDLGLSAIYSDRLK